VPAEHSGPEPQAARRAARYGQWAVAQASSPPSRVCLLTGAGGRLGTVFCRLLGGAYEIAEVHRTLPPSCREGSTSRSLAIEADLLLAGAVDTVVDATLDRFGRVDLLVNAAAVSRWAPVLAERSVLDSIETMFVLNVVVPARLTAALAERCWRRSLADNAEANRNVVNVSSTAGLYVYRGLGQSGYAASKAALNMLTCHLAAELGPLNLRVNAVAPNSFSGIDSSESVDHAIARLDSGGDSGRSVVRERDGETVLHR